MTYHQVLDAAPWSPRYGLGLAVFQNRLWVLGGTGTLHHGDQLNDVWSSGDGVQWRQELASAPWQPRWCHAVFALAGRLWVVGGLASVGPIRNHNDIWSSPDGVHWRREVADAPWPARHVWATAIHNNRSYLLGGATDGTQYYQDVLSSGNGVDWRSETVRKPWFEKRKNHAAVSYQNKLFLTGGSLRVPPEPNGSRMLNDVWSSEDGRRWTCIKRKAAWPARNFHVLVDYQDKMWLIGGQMGDGRHATDLWSTVDGVDWRLETSQFAWPGRHVAGVAVFKNKVWIMGGTSSIQGTSSWNDVWTFEAKDALGNSGS